MSYIHPDRTTAPELSNFPPVFLPDYGESILPNGVKLYTYNSGEEPVTRLTLLWSTGLLESPDRASLNLMHNMLNEGCGDLSGKEVTDILEGNGSWFRSQSGRQSTLLTLHSLNSTADKVFPLLAEIISNPAFPEETLESIKHKNATEKDIALRKPSLQANIISARRLYGEGHPLALYTTPEQILAVTRDEVVDIHRRLMIASRPAVYLTGKITDKILRLLESTIGRIAFNELIPDRLVRKPLLAYSFTSDSNVGLLMPESLQTGVRIVMPTIPWSNPDFIPLQVAAYALGGYFGSRLMSNIREDKGYTYGISAVTVPRLDDSEIVIACECDNKYTSGVLTEIYNEINRMASERMSDEELDTVRNIMISQLASVLDTPLSVASYMEMLASYGASPARLRRKYDEINAITPERIREVTERYIKLQPKVTALAGGELPADFL